MPRDVYSHDRSLPAPPGRTKPVRASASRRWSVACHMNGPSPLQDDDLPGSLLPGETGARLLVTAAEAYPAFEHLVLRASRSVTACFRIFDPDTRLRSRRARAVGDTWADLLVGAMRRGVRVDLAISDFDPVHRPELHLASHRAARRLRDATEAAGLSGQLHLQCLWHPARSGLLPRLLLTPLEWIRLGRLADRINNLSDDERTAWLADAPGLTRLLRTGTDGRLRVRRDRLAPMIPGSHHQKLAVVDGEHLYIGGLDLDERRFDDPDHGRAGSRTWHDVQLILSGPVAAEAEAHLRACSDECAGRQAPAPRRGLLRTLSRKRHPLVPMIGPRPLVKEIAARHLAEIRRARELIYIETQFLRDRRIARALAERARNCQELGLILVLPAAPEDVAFDGNRGLDARYGDYLQTRCLRRIRRAFGDRLALVSPAQPRGVPPDAGRATLHGAPLVYVHAKVSVFDGSCAIVSSANLNGRSLAWDTEAGIALTAPEAVAALRDRLMRHWLPENALPEMLDSQDAPAAWRNLAQRNAETAPGKREGFILPYPEKPARRFARPAPGVPPEMV